MHRTAFLSTTVAAAITGLRPHARERGRLDPLTADEQRADLDELWTAMLDVGAYPFRTSNRAFVEARYRAIRRELQRPLSAPHFALTIAPVFAALNDGHVAILPPKWFMRRLAVPIRVELAGDDLLVIASWNNRVPVGSRLTALNSVCASRLRDLTISAVGGQTAALRSFWFKTRFRTVAAIETNEPHRYEATWISPDGTAGHASLPARAVSLPGMSPDAANYSYRSLPGRRIGFIDYRRCTGLTEFKRFMATTLHRIRAENIQALIVDIRNNGGGESELNDVLWSHVSAKPFRQFGATVIKVSDRVRSAEGRADYIDATSQAAWDAPNGTLITIPVDDVALPISESLRFNGPVALLISGATFFVGNVVCGCR